MECCTRKNALPQTLEREAAVLARVDRKDHSGRRSLNMGRGGKSLLAEGTASAKALR